VNIKKIDGFLALIFCVFLALFLVGCSASDNPPSNTPPTISGIPDVKILLNQTAPIIDLWLYASDKEDPDSALNFRIVQQTNTNAINCYLDANRYLKFNTAQSIGYSEITVEVTDSGNLSGTDVFRITVEPPIYKVHGFDFSPYIDGQDPNWGSVVSEQQLRERMAIIAPFTNWIRSFGSTQGLENTGRVAREFNLHTAIGAWLGKDLNTNEVEMQNLINAAKNGYVDLAVVGSEALLRNDLSEDQLISYIERFRNEVPSITVTTGEVYGELLSHPRIMDTCDVVFVNYYPYWEGIRIDQAMANLHAHHLEVLAHANGKKVIVSEVGWPSAGNAVGEAVPSLENACFYFLNFVSWAQANNTEFFYFEALDEAWKERYEGPQGSHWGVWDKYGVMKQGMIDVFDGKTMPDNWTCKEMPGGPGTPAIEFTSVPPYGSFENLKGQVWHVKSEDYRVAVYIYVFGWWTKPYWNNPLISINCDGTWTCDITTGGSDQNATKIAAYLVPATYSPPLGNGQSTLPEELKQNAVAWTEITRSPAPLAL
jgi:exo-beta-1,3-glucanase (GH17 family)